MVVFVSVVDDSFTITSLFQPLNETCSGSVGNFSFPFDLIVKYISDLDRFFSHLPLG